MTQEKLKTLTTLTQYGQKLKIQLPSRRPNPNTHVPYSNFTVHHRPSGYAVKHFFRGDLCSI